LNNSEFIFINKKGALMKKALFISALLVFVGLLAINTNTFSQGKGKGGNTTTHRFVDANGDGICDNFVDANGDGVCDNCGKYANGSGQGNGTCSKFVDANGDGICDNFVDANGDGVCDNCGKYANGSGQCSGNGCGRGNGYGRNMNNCRYQNSFANTYKLNQVISQNGTNLTFNLTVDSKVTLQIFDRQGNIIDTPFEGNLTSGTHSIDVNTTNYKSGVYFYRLTINGQSFSREFTLVK
jgi:hypothetical protein